MIGAIVGDIVGSIYEWHNIKTKDFKLVNEKSFFTDDTVLTCAVAKALKNSDLKNEKNIKENVVKELLCFVQKYPGAGYGNRFKRWAEDDVQIPYYSYGNGSAMRVSSAGWVANTLKEAQAISKATAEVTHSHPQGILGAQVISSIIFLARQKHNKEDIKKFAQQYYNLDFRLDRIRPYYKFDETCQGTVPQAIVAFLEAADFEDAIRNAISIGGDSDTLGAITGSIAEAYYEIPKCLAKMVEEKVPEDLLIHVIKL